MRKFWNWTDDDGGEESGRTLRLEGAISEETWWDDTVTPAAFRSELYSDTVGDGASPVTVWINSPGGDVFAAAQIYNMLKEYPGAVTVKIDATAASAASVVAMAGDKVLISPVGHIFIHNPSTIAWGDSEEMLKAKRLLDSVKESIINAYEMKTGLPRTKLASMMDAETDMSAQIAVALGFADEVMYQPKDESGNENGNRLELPVSAAFSHKTVLNSLLDKIRRDPPINEQSPQPTLNRVIKDINTHDSIILNQNRGGIHCGNNS